MYPTPPRRHFLKTLGAATTAAGLPPGIARALEIPAQRRTGTIADVEHVVVLMQENRSFDHYFGSLRGVRGFNDPRVLRRPDGQPIWRQANGPLDEVLPFRPPVENMGLTFLPDPPHGWNDTHAAVNNGRMDRFIANKGLTAMTFHERRDMPYHYALASAFTVCDAYHCSLLGPTDPNRYHLWTGWVGNDGKGGGPVITNAEAGYDWSSYPERLQRAGMAPATARAWRRSRAANRNPGAARPCRRQPESKRTRATSRQTRADLPALENQRRLAGQHTSSFSGPRAAAPPRLSPRASLACCRSRLCKRQPQDRSCPLAGLRETF